MNADQIRALQAPLKERCREEPAAALVTLSARSRLDDDSLSCKVETGRAMVRAGLHPATGGDGLSACSGDMLLEALAACAGVTLKAVATATAIPLQDASVGECPPAGASGCNQNAHLTPTRLQHHATSERISVGALLKARRPGKDQADRHRAGLLQR